MRGVPGRILAAALLLLAAAGFVRLYPFQVEIPLKRPFTEIPERLAGWEGRSGVLPVAFERILGVTEYLSREYARGPHRVGVYLGYYSAQRAGAQIHSPRHCLPGGGLVKVSESVLDLSVPGYGPLRAMRAVYRSGGEDIVFLYWYRMRGAHVTNEYLLKLGMVWNSLVHRRNEALFVRLAAAAGPEPVDGDESIRLFMEDFLPVLAGHLPEG